MNIFLFNASAFFSNLLWTVIGLIAFAFVMSVLVIVHEGGHFLAAKKAGILCHEFSVGMGPLIYQKKKGETLYSIRAFPIGGYVSMAGEEIEDNILKGVKKVRLVIEKGRVNKIIVNLDNPKYQDLPIYNLGKYDLIGTKEALPDELFIEVKNDDEEQYNKLIVERNCLVNFEKKAEIQIAPYDRNFVNKPLLNRFFSVFAGPFMNFVLAVVVFFAIGLFTGYADTKHTVIGEVTYVENSNNTLEKGDEITSINGIATSSWDDISLIMAQIAAGGSNYTSKVHVTTKDGKDIYINPSVYVYTIELALLNDGTDDAIIGEYSANNSKTKATIAGLMKNDKIIGIFAKNPKTGEIIDELKYDDDRVLTKSELLAFFQRETIEVGPDILIRYNRDGNISTSEPIEAYDKRTLNSQGITSTKVQLGITCRNKFNLVKLLYMPWVQTGQSITSIVKTLGLIFSNSRIGVDDLSGPVGIFTILKSAVQQGSLFTWMAVLSVNLGFVNLLPLPALDGGRLAFLVYEAITKKKPNAKVENIIHTVGFVLLMGLMVFICFNDVLRCIGR